MNTRLIWDESKRQANLQKHGLDFADANEVLESCYCLDIEVMRDNEVRFQSISYALGFLAVLTVIHTQRDRACVLLVFAPQVQKNGRLIMSGSKTNTMTRSEVLKAVRALTPEMDYVGDGHDEDDRPLTEEELNKGISLARSRGRKISS